LAVAELNFHTNRRQPTRRATATGEILEESKFSPVADMTRISA
jgi:hypothetical protein